MQITLKPTLRQHEAYEALKNLLISVIFFGGGGGGGKSWFICESRLINAYLYPGYRSFIGRNELKRLMQSTFITWTKVCQHHKIPQDDWKLNGQYNYIEFKNGSRIDLLDLKYLPSDPLYERFGSLEYTDGAIEEAGEVNFLAYDVLKSRIGRHLSHDIRPTMLITGNPKKNWTYTEFYKPHKEGTLPDNIAFIQALYNDNPYTAEEYGKQLASIKDKATKERLMFGNWEYDDDPTALMSYDSIVDLFTNTIETTEEKWCVVDVARYGSDKTVISVWKGLEWYKIEVLEKKGGLEVEERIKEILRDERIPYSHCLIDEDGIGGGILDHLRGARGFMANKTPFPNKQTGKPDNFKNLKTQCAFYLAELTNDHKISITWDNETYRGLFIEEAEQLKRKDPDKEGKLEIEPKDKMKEVLGRSPDVLDTAIMRMYFEFTNPTKTTTILDPVTILLSKPMSNGESQITSYE